MTLLGFGEQVNGYDYKVINEREARASAGLIFLFGISSTFSIVTEESMFWSELFTVTFILEFFIRMFISPRYAPYMILASYIVGNQDPEWVEAKPKMFAWYLGLILAAIMSYYILLEIVSMNRMVVCGLCMALLFLESAFGICLGCIVYKKLNVQLQNCSGGVCKIRQKKALDIRKILVLIALAMFFVGVYNYLDQTRYKKHYEVIIVD